MSNIYHIKCPRDVSSREFTSVLESVVSERFGTLLEVTKSEKWDSWGIWTPERIEGERYGFEMLRKGPDTFSGKFTSWMFSDWLCFYIRENVAASLDAICVDYDDTGETWEPTPDKYPDYDSWLHARTVGSWEQIAEMSEWSLDECKAEGLRLKRAYLESLPEKLRNL